MKGQYTWLCIVIEGETSWYPTIFLSAIIGSRGDLGIINYCTDWVS